MWKILSQNVLEKVTKQNANSILTSQILPSKQAVNTERFTSQTPPQNLVRLS